MNKKEFDGKYVGEKLAVNCKTKELAKEFLNLAENFGYRWWNDKSYINCTNWEFYGEQTCYSLYEESSFSIRFASDEDYEVIEYPIENNSTNQEKFDNLYLKNNDTLNVNLVDSKIPAIEFISGGVIKLENADYSREEILEICRKLVDSENLGSEYDKLKLV